MTNLNMWDTIKGNPRYAEKIKRIADKTGVPYEDVAIVLEAYYDVSANMSDERIAERIAAELLDEAG